MVKTRIAKKLWILKMLLILRILRNLKQKKAGSIINHTHILMVMIIMTIIPIIITMNPENIDMVIKNTNMVIIDMMIMIMDTNNIQDIMDYTESLMDLTI